MEPLINAASAGIPGLALDHFAPVLAASFGDALLGFLKAVGSLVLGCVSLVAFAVFVVFALAGFGHASTAFFSWLEARERRLTRSPCPEDGRSLLQKKVLARGRFSRFRPSEREIGIHLLWQGNTPPTPSFIVELLQDQEPAVVQATLKQLKGTLPRSVRNAVRSLARKCSSDVTRLAAARHLASLNDPLAFATMLELALSKSASAAGALAALQRAGSSTQEGVAQVAREGQDISARIAAATAVRDFSSLRDVALLDDALAQKAYDALFRAGSEARAELAQVAQKAKQGSVRLAAAVAVRDAASLRDLALKDDAIAQKACDELVKWGADAQPHLAHVAQRAKRDPVRFTAAVAVNDYSELAIFCHSDDGATATRALRILIRNQPASCEALGQFLGQTVDDRLQEALRLCESDPVRALECHPGVRPAMFLFTRQLPERQREGFATKLAASRNAAAWDLLLDYCQWVAAKSSPKTAPYLLLADAGDGIVPALFSLLDSEKKSNRKLALKALLALRNRHATRGPLRARIDQSKSQFGRRGQAKIAELLRLWDTPHFIVARNWSDRNSLRTSYRTNWSW